MKLLIMGKPGSGKSTLIKKLSQDWGVKRGIVTPEIREEGVRRGFAMELLSDGSRYILSHKDRAVIDSDVIVGVNHVDLDVVDEATQRELCDTPKDEIIIIDELGEMEMLSEQFSEVMHGLFEEERFMLCSIGVVDKPWSGFFKQHSDGILIEINEENRDDIYDALQHFHECVPSYSKLSKAEQVYVKERMRTWFREGQWILIRKLLQNAIGYVAQGRVSELSPDRWEVVGKTNNHIVYCDQDHVLCDCDLFHGRGKFKGEQGICSHVMAIEMRG